MQMSYKTPHGRPATLNPVAEQELLTSSAMLSTPWYFCSSGASEGPQKKWRVYVPSLRKPYVSCVLHPCNEAVRMQNQCLRTSVKKKKHGEIRSTCNTLFGLD